MPTGTRQRKISLPEALAFARIVVRAPATVSLDRPLAEMESNGKTSSLQLRSATGRGAWPSMAEVSRSSICNRSVRSPQRLLELGIEPQHR